MARTTTKMPKRGIIGRTGQLNRAGHHYLGDLSRGSEVRAGTAGEFLEGGSTVVYSVSVWDTVVRFGEAGSGDFVPNIGARLDFEWTLTGVTVMRFPIGALTSFALPFFSVMFIQDETGGRALQFDDDFQGLPVSILEGANDRTLCGFKLLSNSTFTGWIIKDIEATA